jgi:phosphatidate cytidylyltransferase
MKKIIQRFLIFLFGLPLLALLVVMFPQKNHLALNLLVAVFSSLGALEFSGMLKRKNLVIAVPEALILGALGPLAVAGTVSFGLNGSLIPAALVLGASWFLVSGVFSRGEHFENFAGRMAAGLSALIYPGLFLGWIILMALRPQADRVILVFFLLTFANDSAAWAAGMLFGKNNRGIFPASPNKSAAGFAGGFAASILAGVLAARFMPEAFSSPRLPAPVPGIILGFCSALAGSLGDLGESVMKRSAGIKDSGTLIPGRGGVLDTIDSIALAAPVYYGLCRLLFP